MNNEKNADRPGPAGPSGPSADVDPFRWLEEVESPAALAWVRERNERTLGRLKSSPHFKPLESKLRAVLLAEDRIAFGSPAGEWIYNFWQDSRHVRGLWRRTRRELYLRGAPEWQTMLDIDALAEREGENWVFKGARSLPARYGRSLVMLSRGGKDAMVTREFDLHALDWVPGGFYLPEAKTYVDWLDADTLLVGTDTGPGSLTRSGYPREMRRLRRGEDLAQAELWFAGEHEDIYVDPDTYFEPRPSQGGPDGDPGENPDLGRWIAASRRVSFHQTETWVHDRRSGVARPSFARLPFPRESTLVGIFAGNFIAHLQTDWVYETQTFSSGSLVALPEDDWTRARLVWEPRDHETLESTARTRDTLYLNVLQNVQGRLLEIDAAAARAANWTAQPVAMPELGSISLVSHDPFGEVLFVRFEGMTTPTTLYVREGKQAPRVLHRLPERFDASNIQVTQRRARSKDGTEVPYFIAHRKDLPRDGSNPTLLYGYGGFLVSLTPTYAEVSGKAWLEQGGVYVIANIRGGGEFGPRWHRAALRENRQRAFDDFAAVAEDLIRERITSPAHLGIMGGSNGGLLMGASFTQRPDLFAAVVCQVPLLDMVRYHQLLAGASWIEEYGDPDSVEFGAVLRSYSPYHQLRADRKYPEVFFATSTKDDRVHPAHARKMAARMEAQGHPCLYYENIDGGHSGAANLEERVQRVALEYTYLTEKLS